MERKQLRILDGGFGSLICKKVNTNIDADPLWSARLLVTNKEDVVNTHLDFLRAGSDVIETNTYQASINGFVKHLNLDEKSSYNVIKEAVELAKNARSIYNAENPKKNILIAGSVGPYGAALHDCSEYTGSYKDSVTSLTLSEWHRPRILALIEGGVDLLAFETLPCKKEAEALLNVLKEHPNVKAWLSFTCKDGKTLASGENFQTTIKECYKMHSDQLVAVGANCVSPLFVDELFAGINDDMKSDPIPLLTMPNSGENYKVNEGWYGLEQCKPFVSYLDKWLDMGITWIGGCCRVYPEDITNIKEAVETWKTKQL